MISTIKRDILYLKNTSGESYNWTLCLPCDVKQMFLSEMTNHIPSEDGANPDSQQMTLRCNKGVVSFLCPATGMSLHV